MTYWIYNPQSMREIEMEGTPTFDDLERCEEKKLLIFTDYVGLRIRKQEDENNSFLGRHSREIKHKSLADEWNEVDLSDLNAGWEVNHVIEKEKINDEVTIEKTKENGRGRKSGYKRSDDITKKIQESKKQKKLDMSIYDIQFNTALEKLKIDFKIAKRNKDIEELCRILERIN